MRGRAAGGIALGAAFGLIVVGGATADPSPDTPVAATAVSTPSASPTTSSPSASPTSTPPPTRTPTASVTTSTASPDTAARGTALAAVAQLTVKGRAPTTRYSREAFGQAWFDTDRNGCDTRNDILRRDLTDKSMKNSCKVLAGTLSHGPYTGKTIRFVYGASEVDIDHVVALSDAWQKGAATWSAGKRLAFANDPLSLLAVDASANRAKGDGDTATWLPPNTSYRCTYVARQVAVKAKYQVWVTSAERAAMVRVLSS
ncbi:MAG: HNH endonuclease family protein, partial [Actinomycetota bacterium]|nr:HNH endonuclease family protein [Actinomycetota bacterium]